jgi:hypothetical protein
MIGFVMTARLGTRLFPETSVPTVAQASAHACKPWLVQVIQVGIGVDDNSTGVSAHGRRHE